MIQLESVISFLTVGIILGVIYAIANKANLIPFHDGIAIRPNFWQSWRVGREDSHDRLAVALLVALLIILLSGWMFGSIAEDVFNHDSITRYDVVFGRWLLYGATQGGSEFFSGVTALGSANTIVVGVVLFGIWLMVRKKWLQIGTLLAAVGGGSLLNWLLKDIFMRPRPDFPNAFYRESSYSFPSGHAMTAVLFYGMAAYLLSVSLTNKSWRYVFVLLFMTIAFLIGLSRLYLGVHYLSDVLGGWAAGLAWLMVCLMVSGLFENIFPHGPITNELYE